MKLQTLPRRVPTRRLANLLRSWHPCHIIEILGKDMRIAMTPHVESFGRWTVLKTMRLFLLHHLLKFWGLSTSALTSNTNVPKHRAIPDCPSSRNGPARYPTPTHLPTPTHSTYPEEAYPLPRSPHQHGPLLHQEPPQGEEPIPALIQHFPSHNNNSASRLFRTYIPPNQPNPIPTSILVPEQPKAAPIPRRARRIHLGRRHRHPLAHPRPLAGSPPGPDPH
jgi:hypothetical protein